jgi:hypothetical protein
MTAAAEETTVAEERTTTGRAHLQPLAREDAQLRSRDATDQLQACGKMYSPEA